MERNRTQDDAKERVERETVDAIVAWLRDGDVPEEAGMVTQAECDALCAALVRGEWKARGR